MLVVLSTQGNKLLRKCEQTFRKKEKSTLKSTIRYVSYCTILFLLFRIKMNCHFFSHERVPTNHDQSLHVLITVRFPHKTLRRIKNYLKNNDRVHTDLKVVRTILETISDLSF